MSGLVSVDEKKCVGCGLCVTACPREAIETCGIAMIDENRCSECFGGMGLLKDLSVSRRTTFLKQDKNWRKACIRHCPVKAIKEIEA